MCGIAGVIGKQAEENTQKMLAEIYHRGHDDQAVFKNGNVCLGMNRLAIIDLVKGLYPMRYANYTLVYNGEIYNYIQIRKKLERLGHTFSTSSDAEIILPLYHIYKEKAFSLLDGMFAISIYDNKTKQLILVRDKVGEKPLYYRRGKESFVFASEIKAIAEVFKGNCELNASSAKEYLYHGYVRGPNTLIHDVYKVLPAHILVINEAFEIISDEPYWKTPDFLGSKRETIDQLDRILRKSTVSRMMADVPVGCFLSGGVDSSLMTRYASEINPDIHSFSVRFPGSIKYDESFFARYAASLLHTKHHEIICSEADVYKIVINIGTLIDEPISDPAFIPTLILSKEAKKYVSVVLSGEGADELFGGYPRYIRQLIIERLKSNTFALQIIRMLKGIFIPKKFKNFFLPLTKRYHTQNIWNTHEIDLLIKKSPRENAAVPDSVHHPLSWMQKNDFTGYLSDQLLMKVDKATMSQTLEARAPYLSSALIVASDALHFSDKIRFYQSKYSIKKVAEKYFPFWFVWRIKHGFSVPLGFWFKTFLTDVVIKLPADVSSIFGPHCKPYIQKVVDEHVSGVKDNTDKIWSLYILISWIKTYAIRI